MLERGKVIEAENGVARVRIAQGTCCSEGCGECHIGDSLYVTARDPIGVKQGQLVEVDFKSGGMVGTVLLVFWMPLILGGLGYWLGNQAGLMFLGSISTALSVVLCILFIALAIAIIVIVERRLSRKNRGVVITRIVVGPPTPLGVNNPTSYGKRPSPVA